MSLGTKFNSSGPFIYHRNNFEAADLLVEASADVNSKDSSGNTPVALAAALGHHKVLEVLIASLRVNVNESDQVDVCCWVTAILTTCD